MSYEINLVFDSNGNIVPFSEGKGTHAHKWRMNEKTGTLGRKSHDRKNLHLVDKKFDLLISKIVKFNQDNNKYYETGKRNRKIVLPDFYGEGKHVYDDELSWRIDMKKEAGSLVSRENFRYLVEEVGLNLSFYYIDGDTFYGIHTEVYPIEVKILPRDTSMKFLGFQCPGNTHPDGEVIASFDNEHDIWGNLRIDGKSLEEVLERSYIIGLN